MSLITASSVKYDLPAAYRVIGYYIYDCMDKDVADIRDLLIDDVARVPRYAIIEIGGMMSIKGKKLLIPWAALEKGGMSRMNMKWPIEQIIGVSAPFVAHEPTRAEEESIHSYFGVEPYWLDEKNMAAGKTETVTKPLLDDKQITNLVLDKDDKQ